MLDYWHLNANKGPLTAAAPNIPNVTASTKEKRFFFMAALQKWDKEKFAFPYRLHQEYKLSLMIAHAAIAEFLQAVSLPQDEKLYQYTDDIAIEGDSHEKAGEEAEVQQLTETLGCGRKHVPVFPDVNMYLIFCHCLPTVLTFMKGKQWEWNSEQEGSQNPSMGIKNISITGIHITPRSYYSRRGFCRACYLL